MLKLNRYDHAAYWSFFCYSGCSFAIPVVMVELAAALGFPLKDGGMSAGGMLHVVRSATMLAAMLICGFVAGRFGKRRTMGALRTTWSMPPALMPPFFNGNPSAAASSTITTGIANEHPE